MMLLVNEVFKVYNYVLIHNCIQQYKLNYFSMIYGYYDYYYMYIYGTCMSTYLLWKTLCDYFDGTVIVEQYEYEKDFTCFGVCLKFTRTKDFLVIADYKHVINMRAFFYLHIKVLIERHLHNIDFLTAIKVLWIIFVISVALLFLNILYLW